MNNALYVAQWARSDFETDDDGFERNIAILLADINKSLLKDKLQLDLKNKKDIKQIKI